MRSSGRRFACCGPGNFPALREAKRVSRTVSAHSGWNGPRSANLRILVAEELDYIRVTYVEPHAARGRQMLSAHPELRTLAGPMPISAVWTVALVTTQFVVAFLVADRSWLIWLPCAYVLGATIDHALWVLIHE